MKSRQVVFNQARRVEPEPDILVGIASNGSGNLVLQMKAPKAAGYEIRVSAITFPELGAQKMTEIISFQEWQKHQFSSEIRRGFMNAADILWRAFSDRAGLSGEFATIPRLRWNRRTCLWEQN